MTRKHILVILFTLYLVQCKINLLAQHAASIGINLNAGTSSFPLHGRFGKGVSLEYQRSISTHSSLRLSAGYERFNQRFPHVEGINLADTIIRIGIRAHGLGFVPIRAGYQYNVSTYGLYIYGEIGLSPLLVNYESPSLPDIVFTSAIGAGYKWKLPGHHFLQSGIAFNYYNLKAFRTREYIGLRIAYGFLK